MKLTLNTSDCGGRIHVAKHKVLHVNTTIMKKIMRNLILLLIISLCSCSKENSDPLTFNPTDHIISKLGSEMRFVVKVPEKGIYNFSSIDSASNCEGSLCKEFIVPPSEMNLLAQNLSDTVIFKWEIMTAESPYPENHFMLFVFGGLNDNNFMCSIGNDNSSINNLIGLSKSFTGDARIAIEEIITYFQTKTK